MRQRSVPSQSINARMGKAVIKLLQFCLSIYPHHSHKTYQCTTLWTSSPSRHHAVNLETLPQAPHQASSVHPANTFIALSHHSLPRHYDTFHIKLRLETTFNSDTTQQLSKQFNYPSYWRLYQHKALWQAFFSVNTTNEPTCTNLRVITRHSLLGWWMVARVDEPLWCVGEGGGALTGEWRLARVTCRCRVFQRIK